MSKQNYHVSNSPAKWARVLAEAGIVENAEEAEKVIRRAATDTQAWATAAGWMAQYAEITRTA